MKIKKRGLILLSIPLVLLLCLLFMPAAKSFNLDGGPIGDFLPKFMTDIEKSAPATAIAKVFNRITSGRASQQAANKDLTANLSMPDGMQVDDFVRTYSPANTGQNSPARAGEAAGERSAGLSGFSSGQSGSGFSDAGGSGFQGSASGGGSYGSAGGPGSGYGGSAGAGASGAAGAGAKAGSQDTNSSGAGTTANSGTSGPGTALTAPSGNPGNSQPYQSASTYFPPSNGSIGPSPASSPSRWDGDGIPDNLKKYGSDSEREYPHGSAGPGSSPGSDPGLPLAGSFDPLSNEGFPGKDPLGALDSGGNDPLGGGGLDGPLGPMGPSGASAPIPAVPEPATLALLGSGLAGLYFLARRRKR